MPRAPREVPAEGRRPRARRGSLEGRLVDILAQAPEGATIAEIEAAGSADDEPLKVPSIRATLQRLLAMGRVEREGRSWRLAPEPAPSRCRPRTLEEPAADEARNPRAITSPPRRPAGRPDGSAAVHLGELAGDAGVGVLGGRQPLAQRRPVARTAFARGAARSNRLPAPTTASASTYRARNASSCRRRPAR